MGKVSEKIEDILEESQEARKNEKISMIELFMNWLFSQYEFRLNMLSMKPEYRPLGDGDFRELDDQNYNTISILAEINGFSKSMVEKMNRIIMSNYVEQVNEIKDYFESIKPLARIFNIDITTFDMPTVRAYFDCLQLSNDLLDKELLYNIFARWAVASVNSALGIKHNDVMLILSGSQGLYKTSYLNNLVPNTLGKEKYLVTGHIEPTLTSHNTANYLCEKFIINIDDQLEVIFGKEYNSLKAIISIDRVTSRRVYAKFDRTRKRIANFVGSVNSNEFLIDNQNRRYFVIEISGIDPNYINIDMDRFWSEAYYLATKVNPYTVYDREIYMAINTISSHYTQSSIEQVLLTRFFSPEINDNKNVELFMTNGEIIMEIQRLTTKQLSQIRLANELKRLGFKRITKYSKEFGYSRWGYQLFTTDEYSMTYFKYYKLDKEKEFF